MRLTSPAPSGRGPNRLDALVWALTDLFLAEETPGAAFLELARRDLASGDAAGAVDTLDPAPGSVEWMRTSRET